LPIADWFVSATVPSVATLDWLKLVMIISIVNRQSKIGNEKAPRLTTRSLLNNDKIAELFSGLFYVAASRLNSPRELSNRIETPG